MKEEENRATRTKGKLKETQHDMEEEAETQRKFARISTALSDLRKLVADGKHNDEPGVPGLSLPTRLRSYASHDQYPALTAAVTASLDNEPIFNPFTNSYVYRETGFEPGPSGLSRDQGEQNETPAPFKSRDETFNNRREPTASFVNSATVESMLADQKEDEAIEIGHRNNKTIDEVKPRHPNAHQIGRHGLGYLASIFGSWSAPSLRGFFYGRNSSPKSAVYPASDGQLQDGVIQDNVSSITPSTPSTAFKCRKSHQENIVSMSTTPSSPWSVGSKHCSSAENSPELTYRQDFLSIDEGDNNDSISSNDQQKIVPQKPIFSGISNARPKTTVGPLPSQRQPKAQKQVDDKEELKNGQPSKAPALYFRPVPEDEGKQQKASKRRGIKMLAQDPLESISSQDKALSLSLGKEDLADHNQVALSPRLAILLQVQEEKEVSDRQRELEIERDHMEAMRLQEMFDEEVNRERQATLEYVKGLNETAEWREDESIVQAQQQAAIEFAQNPYEANKQANIERAVQLHNERMVQRDREYARQVQAEMDNEAASEYSVGSKFGGLPLLDPWTFQNTPTCSKEKMSLFLSESQQANQQTFPSMPFQRFPSFRGAQRSVPPVVKQSTVTGRESFFAQDTAPQILQDRALALKLHEAEKKKVAQEEAQSQKDLSAWQRVQKTGKGIDNASSKPGSLGAKRERAGHAQKPERAQTQVGKAQYPHHIQAPPQLHATQEARTAGSEDVADCGICGDSITKTRLVRPCEHFYCRDCLKGQASVPLNDSQL